MTWLNPIHLERGMTDEAWLAAVRAARNWATEHGHPQPDDRMLDAFLAALASAGRLVPADTYTEVEYQHGDEQRTVWVGPWQPAEDTPDGGGR